MTDLSFKYRLMEQKLFQNEKGFAEENMIILISGASHTGKTLLAQRMLEKSKYPYLSMLRKEFEDLSMKTVNSRKICGCRSACS